MGLERFEVRFFFGEKFTKIDLALEVVIKNLSKVVWGLSVKFSRIWLKNFFVVKIHMGTPLEWKILLHNFFFSFGIDPRKVPISKTASVRSKAFRYDSLETRELFWVKIPMGIQVHFRDFFCLCEWILTWLKIDYKWGSHWLGHIKHWLESKVLLARSPPGGSKKRYIG